MKDLLINCDMGEWDAPHLEQVDDDIMPLVDMSNIACGGHAGSREIIIYTLKLADKYKVKTGAHPGYEDRTGFGRTYQSLSSEALESSISKQLKLFMECCKELDIAPFHVKAHGALYHACNHREMESKVLIDLMLDLCPNLFLLVAPKSMLERKAKDAGIKTLAESFVDRRYNDDLSLVSRQFENAVIFDEKLARNQFKGLKNGEITSLSGVKQVLQTDTACIHGDNPNCISILKSIRASEAV